MPTHILVATPHPAFGELIRLSLEESSNYRVRLVQTSLDAIAAVGRVDFEIGIVDCDLRDQPTAALAGILRQQRPDIHLIFIPPNNDPEHPSLAGVKIDGILKKPFYLPDLITMVETLINPQPMEPEPAQPVAAPVMQETVVVEAAPPVADEMPWLSDPVQASQHLTRLLLESSAHAALILQNNRIWAYAGHLDQPAAQEVTSVIARYWNWEQKVDLARFVRLDTTSTDYLVYATSMKGVYVLALVFDIAMPLTRIRTQANNLARELSTRPVEIKPFISPLVEEPPVEENIFVPQEAAPVVETAVEMAEVPPVFVEPPKPAVFIEQPAPISAELPAAPVAGMQAAEEIQNLYEDDFEDEMEGPDLNLAKFLESVPPPNPV
ncbi:MAG: response regulator, partial [Anaerolineaceae bacterium]|nr:response regulator [Anaerolineaceae bacterium]